MTYNYRKYRAADGFLEEAMCKVDNIFRDVISYLRNRFFTKSHIIKTGLKKGQWHETQDQILHGSMEAFCNYVEIQLAWRGTWSDDSFKSKWWKPFRSRAYAEQNWAWECELIIDEDMQVSPGEAEYGELTSQAISARKQREIYYWWRDKRPTRPNSYNELGDAEAWKLFEQYLGDKKVPAEMMEQYQIIDHVTKQPKYLNMLIIDDYYDLEDSEMLKQLIDIRTHLWT